MDGDSLFSHVVYVPLPCSLGHIDATTTTLNEIDIEIVTQGALFHALV